MHSTISTRLPFTIITTLSISIRSKEELFQQYVGNWQRLRPVWLLYLLGSLSQESIRLQRVPVVDTFLERGAGTLGKGVQAVEVPDDQCKPFNKLSAQQVRCLVLWEGRGPGKIFLVLIYN